MTLLFQSTFLPIFSKPLGCYGINPVFGFHKNQKYILLAF